MAFPGFSRNFPCAGRYRPPPPAVKQIRHIDKAGRALDSRLMQTPGTRAYFIAATGTDIGKTFLASALLRHWREAGLKAEALKPVVSGFDPARPELSDSAYLLAALGRAATPEALDAISPWRFRAPLSPDMAARREGRVVNLHQILACCQDALKGPHERPYERLLIEGAGGLMSPIAEDATVLDWAHALNLPILLLAGGYLGTISHSLTALASAKAAGARIAALILNGGETLPVPLAETAETLARHWPGVPILSLPYEPDKAAIAKLAAAIDALET